MLFRSEKEIMVVAETEREAEHIANESIREEISLNGVDLLCPREIKDKKSLPKGWADALPWGGSGNQTCGAILDAAQATAGAAPVENPAQGKLPFDPGTKP